MMIVPQEATHFDSALRLLQHIADSGNYDLDHNEMYCHICEYITAFDQMKILLSGEQVKAVESAIFELADLISFIA